LNQLGFLTITGFARRYSAASGKWRNAKLKEEKKTGALVISNPPEPRMHQSEEIEIAEIQ
jgi:hypothetical protein